VGEEANPAGAGRPVTTRPAPGGPEPTRPPAAGPTTPPPAARTVFHPAHDRPIFSRSLEPCTRTDTIDALTSKQRAHLRSLAHHLKPILHVGSDGVTDAVVRSVEEAFNTRELLKVKVQDGAPLDAREAGRTLAERIEGAHLPQTIGRTIVLYRPFPDDPEIRLPR
jgi:RNA-binding protein